MSAYAKRGRGRPPLVDGDTAVSITVAIPSKHLAHLYEQARQERRDIRDHIRLKLSEPLNKEPKNR